MSSIRILAGDCRDVLANMPADSAQCVVTSPPYYGLRDYGVADQIGLEATPDEYLATMVSVFREVRRVLRDDGTCWVNMGDSYWNGGGEKRDGGHGFVDGGKTKLEAARGTLLQAKCSAPGYKPKDLLMMPARLALALQADGWWLRSDIIWHKPNPMPESVTDRPTSAHEHVFLLTKRATYYYDADAVREEAEQSSIARLAQDVAAQEGSWRANGGTKQNGPMRAVGSGTRNLRNVWTLATHAYSAAHFATFPPALAERCIKAGSRMGDTILDPFAGAGTTLLVADRLQRRAIGIELNPAYTRLAMQRCHDDAPLFTSWPPADDPADTLMADLFAGHGT
jgi:DNA modification methylase